jgi:hypothetical protein
VEVLRAMYSRWAEGRDFRVGSLPLVVYVEPSHLVYIIANGRE